MLAKKAMLRDFEPWNNRWHAPHGRKIRGQARIGPLARLAGPFAYQANSSTRRVEYPWAFSQATPSPGEVVIEIGGGLSGFQFALASTGAIVHNIDPLVEYGGKDRYDKPEIMHERLNQWFRTDVHLHRTTVDKVHLSPHSIDTAFCISTIEHLPQEARTSIMAAVHDWLKPGGRFILTVDLFLDLVPFSRKGENRWGSNTNIKELVGGQSWRVVVGDPAELYGFDEFEAESVLGRLDSYILGDGYPVLASLFVLEKGSIDQDV